MANGDYAPACHNCTHLVSDSSNEHCGIHDFVMPHIRHNGNVKICKDYTPKSGFLTERGSSAMSSFLNGAVFRQLQAGTLYYDASYSYGRQFYGELDKFYSLNNFVFDVQIFKDDEFGWMILLERFCEERRQFPRNGSRITLQMGGTEHSHTIRRVRRPIVASASQHVDEWVVNRKTRTQSVIFSETSPTALRDWLDKWIDAEAAWEDCLKPYLDIGIVAFIEPITDGQVYRLRPAFHFYPKLLRQ